MNIGDQVGTITAKCVNKAIKEQRSSERNFELRGMCVKIAVLHRISDPVSEALVSLPDIKN